MKQFVTTGLAFLVLMVLPFGSASGQATTASITGTVVDEDGEPLPGANVVAVHEPSGTQYGAATSENGRYTLRGLRSGGPYTVTASFVGYRSVQETDVTVRLEQQRRIDFQLEAGDAELEAVEVIGERRAVISRDRTGAARNVSAEELDRLPSISREFSDFARLIPQAGGSGAGNSLAGRNEKFNRVQLDGSTLDDVFGLGQALAGSNQGAQPFSLDAVEEFNIDIAPFDVRSGNFTGGQINAVTKSGTNEFEGSFRFLGRNESFVGDLDGAAFDDFGETFFTGTLGGPIIEDELFFFVSAETRQRSDPLDAQVAGTGATGGSVFDLGDDELNNLGFDTTEDVLNEIQNISQNQYGWDPGGISPISFDTDNYKVLAKIDWNINENHRLSLRHNYVDAYNDDGVSRSTTSFNFDGSQFTRESTQNSTSLQLDSNIGQNMFNEFKFSYTRLREPRVPQAELRPDVSFSFENSDASMGQGIGRFSQANNLEQDLFEITNDFTWDVGDHTLTFGTNNEIFSFTNRFIQDFVGSYDFEPFVVTDEDGNVIREVDAIEAFERGLPSDYRFSESRIEGDPTPEAEFTAFQLGGYAQTQWSVTPDFTVTTGLRIDVPVIPDEPFFNEDAEDAFGRSTSNIASGNAVLSPRLGFNFNQDLFLDGYSTQIRGGTGVFSGRPPFVWISNQFSNTGVDFSRIRAEFDPGELFFDEDGNQIGECFSPSGDPADHPRPGDCQGAIGTEETTEVNFVDEDFDYPTTWRTNLAIDQELPGNFVATLEGLFSNSINEVNFRNENIEPLGEDAYGRTYYGERIGPRFFPAFASDRNIVDERFTDAIVLENTSRGFEASFTAQLQRNVAEGLSGSLSYTYSRANTVNAGTSSRAISNWQFNPSVDVNNPESGVTDFERRHRVLAGLNYRIPWSERFATTFGLIYEGQSGQPFSWIYIGDAGGDGEAFNNLVYVPESEDEVFLESQNWDALDTFIESEDGLREHRGEFADRGSARDPFQHILDLRVNQEIATFGNQRIEITAKVENFLNLLNSDWGRIQFSSFNDNVAWAYFGRVSEDDIGSEIAGREVTADDVGKDIIDFDESTLEDRQAGEFLNTANTSSRWQIQLGARYTF